MRRLLLVPHAQCASSSCLQQFDTDSSQRLGGELVWSIWEGPFSSSIPGLLNLPSCVKGICEHYWIMLGTYKCVAQCISKADLGVSLERKTLSK